MPQNRFELDLIINTHQAAAAGRQTVALLQSVENEARRSAAAIEKMADSMAAGGQKVTRSWGTGLMNLQAGLGVAQLGMEKLVGLATEFGQAIQANADRQKQFGRDVIDQREALGELATLQGKQPTTQFALQFAAFNARTGMKPEESLKLQTEFANSGEQYVGKKLSEEHAVRAQELAGRLAIAKKIDPGLFGGLVGQLAGTKDWEKQYGDRAPEELVTEAFRVFMVGSRGRGDNAVLIRQATAMIAQTVNENPQYGTFATGADAMALISLMAESRPEEAEAHGRALIRVMQGHDPKARKLLARAHIQPGKGGFQENIGKIADVIRQDAQEQGIPIQMAAAQYGMTEQERGGLALAGNKGPEILADRAAQAAKITPQTTHQAVEQYEHDPNQAGGLRQAEAQVKQAQQERGARESRLTAARTLAESELLKENALDTSATSAADFVADWVDPAIHFKRREHSREERISLRAMSDLATRGRKAGLNISDREAQQAWLSPWSPEGRTAAFNTLSDKVEAAERKKQLEATAKLTQSIDQLNATMGGGRGAAGPGAVAPRRN